MENNALYENMLQELRRGVIVLAVLNLLQTEQYGYSILKELSDKGMDVDQGTLYPLLRRLENQGLLESKWRLEESRPRRYYVISPTGHETLNLLNQEWNKMSAMMQNMMVDDESRENGA